MIRNETKAGRRHPARVDYDSRFDLFMREKAPSVPVIEWPRHAGVKRSAFNRQRLPGANPRCVSVAKLVRTASRILARPVMATELFDVGEDEPIGSKRLFEENRRVPWRREFDSRLGRTLTRINIGPAELQRLSGVTKTGISRICNDRVSPRIAIVRSLVAALRRAGYDVRARDVADVGDDPPPSTRRDKSSSRGLV